MAERRNLAIGLVLLVVPLVGAMVSLFAGLAAEQLTLVYLSIGLSVVALPAMVMGVVLIVRAASHRKRP